MRKNLLKEKLQNGEVVYGPFMKLMDPAIIEILGNTGFDFAIIDTEHGPYSIESAQNMVRAADLRGITPIIRIPENEAHLALRALDIGAGGVQIPQVSSKEAAIQAGQCAKYHPKGDRGVCCFTRAAEYGNVKPPQHFETSNAETVVIVHIEGMDGINNLDEILTVDGLDVIFLGPWDLSQSCGVPGQVDHPDVTMKMEDAVKRCRDAGKAVGTFVVTQENAKKWKNIGVQYISTWVDANIFHNACADIMAKLRG
jgi:4-hydroxy-2-oxoheptanedioate aldolase